MARLPGKRVGKWEYHHDGVVYHFEVRLDTDGNFLLHCVDQLDIELAGTVLKDLKKTAKERVIESMQTEWEEWISVDADCNHGMHGDNLNDEEHWARNGSEVRIELDIDRYLFGKTPAGVKIHKDKTATHIRKGWPTERERRCDDVVWIKATPEVESALLDLQRRMKGLGEQLTDFLSQKKIVKSLATVGSKLLPAPKA